MRDIQFADDYDAARVAGGRVVMNSRGAKSAGRDCVATTDPAEAK
jgi:hypothetical protein